MNWLATISTACNEISAIFVIIGLVLIKKRKLEAHRKAMFMAAVFALTFFVIYSYRTAFVGNTPFTGPDSWKTFYIVFLIFHIVLATVGAVLGVISIVAGVKKNFQLHRKIGPFTSLVWLTDAVSAGIVYVMLYVIWDTGSTTNLLDAIIGK